MKELVLAALAVFALTGPAAAAIDQQADLTWTRTIGVEAIGNKCNWLDAATRTKLKALEDASHAAILAKATDAERTELTTNDEPKERAWVAAKIDKMPCEANARRYFDTQLAQLLK
jgi:hypothetical protein